MTPGSAIVFVVLVLFGVVAFLIHQKRRPSGVAVAGSIFWDGVKSMSKTLQVNTPDTASVEFTDKGGNAVAIVGVPAWSTDNPSALSAFTPAADGLSVNFTTGTAPGNVTFTVTAEGDPTTGVDTVTVSAVLAIVPAEATGGTITFG